MITAEGVLRDMQYRFEAMNPKPKSRFLASNSYVAFTHYTCRITLLHTKTIPVCPNHFSQCDHDKSLVPRGLHRFGRR
jgi:hypothetical protein